MPPNRRPLADVCTVFDIGGGVNEGFGHGAQR
jgi:hypothetical protein